MADKIMELVQGGRRENIVLLSLWDLLRARRNEEYRNYVLNAALVIPISKSLVSGARFLTGKTPVRYMPFDFTIRLLTILEKKELSLYLLGSRLRILKRAEKNLRQTFPKLRIVGRYTASFKRYGEETVLEAERKASPSLLLVGKGIHGEERWIARNNAKLSPGLRMWCSDLFEVFAERKKRPSQAIFDRGLEWFGFCIKNPLRFFRIVCYLYYKLLLVIYRLFKRR
ncbi:WecB/TagA/CpsF family glycosyltransferase [Treponema sp. OttesenSCG-928-L16]|nr:WecB/TagA/CpsF family glycosyltransferase [Treponema sp. OttesenSCG-928-L16]